MLVLRLTVTSLPVYRSQAEGAGETGVPTSLYRRAGRRRGPPAQAVLSVPVPDDSLLQSGENCPLNGLFLLAMGKSLKQNPWQWPGLVTGTGPCAPSPSSAAGM